MFLGKVVAVVCCDVTFPKGAIEAASLWNLASRDFQDSLPHFCDAPREPRLPS